MVAQTAAFKKAVEDSRKLKAKPNNDELLEVPTFPLILCFSAGESNTDMLMAYRIQLYANYKQGTGEDFSKATQPGTFAFQVHATLLSSPCYPRLAVYELCWLTWAVAYRRSTSTMHGRKSLSKIRSPLLLPSSTTSNWWRS